MSQNQMIRGSLKNIEQNQDQYDNQPIIGVYESRYIIQNQHQQQVNKFYYPINYQCCGYFQQPDMTQILKKKKKEQFNDQSTSAQVQLMPFDGAHVESMNIDHSSDEILRQKIRQIRDNRQQFFYDNGELLIQKQFFQQQLSRLANISYEQNHSIRTFHKNAILSQRNNQKKNVSFQLVINFGDIWFNKHLLQNQQQKIFQQIRPLIRQWSQYSTYPTLPQLKKQIDYLQDLKFQRQQKFNIKIQKDKIVSELQSKIQACQQIYNKQKQRIEDLIKKIVDGWKHVKNIRKNTGIQSVPWKIQIKQTKCENGKLSFDLGISQLQIPALNAHKKQDIQNQRKRRQLIRSQRYYLKVYINENQVAKTNKFNIQWPSFKVNLNQQVNITVYSAPYKIVVQIIKSGFIDQVIDVVNMSLPGVNSKTISASEKKISFIGFSANTKQSKANKQQTKAPSGMIFYSIEWKGQGSRMPPSIMVKSRQEQTACTQDSQTDITQKKQNLQQLFDIKDPRYQHKSIKLRIKDQVQQKNNLLPFNDIYSTRLLLLKMRNRNPDIEKVPIPLLQQQARKRPDLLTIIDKQKNKNQYSQSTSNIKYFHPTINDFYNRQKESIINEIKAILKQIDNFKVASNRSNSTNLKYKIAEQVIEEHIFQQMESPIVIFFKNIFTQKRKLGPKKIYKVQPRLNISSQIQVNFHIRSARNLPIRQSSQQSIKQYLQEQARLNNMSQMIGGVNSFNMTGMRNFFNQNDMYANYGMGLYNQRPSVNMTGHTFFQPNLGNPNRLNQQVISYDGKNTLERVNTRFELRFKKNMKVSQCFQGPFPEWNQTLSFMYNLKTENSSIEKIYYNNEKVIKLIVFDITEKSKSTSEYTKISIKKSKFYLGRIQVPFSLITVMPTVNGIFKLERPFIIFSYTVKKQGLFGVQNQLSNNNNTNNNNNFDFNNIDIPSYVNLDMFIEPHIDTLISMNNDRKFIPGVENTLILQKASDWLQDLNTKRYVKLWLNNLDQKSIFISRFLSDNVCPPLLNLGSHSQQNSRSLVIQRCAKFVSLIPLKYNCKLLQNTEQFHLKVQQILKLKMGQDHGILLCNYFNYIDKNILIRTDVNIQSYLIIGKAFPYGKAIFVLRRDKKTDNCQIWDPFKGQSYFFPGKQEQTTCFCFSYKRKKDNIQSGSTISKDICPMFEVTCIVSKQNVYVNQQTQTNPYLIDFDLENNSNWIPFLTQRTRPQYFQGGNIPSYQPEITAQFYKQYPQNQQLLKQIQDTLTNYIKEQMSEQRKKLSTTYVTQFNGKLSTRIMDNLLLYCELIKNDYRMTCKESSLYKKDQDKYMKALRQLQDEKIAIKNIVDSDKNLFGFTMNFTLTTKQQIWEKIQDTQIHLQQNMNMEFVLAVRCFQYPCHLYSVWIFIGAVE